MLGLQRLGERRMRSDLIETFKILNRKYDINPELFFQLDEGPDLHMSKPILMTKRGRNRTSCLHSLLPMHLDRRLSPQGLDPLKSFLKFTLARSATAPSYNMALIRIITTSIKSYKSSFPTTPYIQCLASLFPISIAVVPLYSAYLCVCLCVSMFLSVCCYYCFFLIVVFTYSAL